MVEELRNNLHNTVKDTYSINAVCKSRKELYINSLIKKDVLITTL